MEDSEIKAEKYWNERYRKEGQLWGARPSQSLWSAIQVFGTFAVNYVLIPGCGYGRLSRLFSMSGFSVAGVDISDKAIEMARQLDPQGVYYQASVLKMDFDKLLYDAIYSFNTLHLLMQEDRLRMIAECRRKLKPGGLMFITVFSDEEEDYKRSLQVESGTFETKAGRPAHYFSEKDLKDHFRDDEVIDCGMVHDAENHGGKEHIHHLRYICLKTA
jgi:SAM-dependent methyltransferase